MIIKNYVYMTSILQWHRKCSGVCVCNYVFCYKPPRRHLVAPMCTRRCLSCPTITDPLTWLWTTLPLPGLKAPFSNIQKGHLLLQIIIPSSEEKRTNSPGLNNYLSFAHPTQIPCLSPSLPYSSEGQFPEPSVD